MASDILVGLVMGAGLFSLGLGAWHVGVPRRFGFREAIDPRRSEPVGIVRLGPWRHEATRGDVLGVAGVMNAATSYVLLSIGALGLAAPAWVGTPAGQPLALWVAGWWAIRSVMQLPMGRRTIDLVLVAGFAALAVLFVAAAFA